MFIKHTEWNTKKWEWNSSLVMLTHANNREVENYSLLYNNIMYVTFSLLQEIIFLLCLFQFFVRHTQRHTAKTTHNRIFTHPTPPPKRKHTFVFSFLEAINGKKKLDENMKIFVYMQKGNCNSWRQAQAKRFYFYPYLL